MKQANPHLAARRAEKAALLPRAAQLAAEGRSYREIADALGIAKSTVCQWLRDRPLGRAAAKALGTGLIPKCVMPRLLYVVVM